MDPHPKVQIASDGSLLLNFGRYGQEVEVATISADGRRVLTVHEVGKAEIWDAASGERVGEICPDSPLQGTNGTGPTTEEFEVFIEAAALSPDGSTALLGLNDGSAGLFQVADGIRLATLRSPEAPTPVWGVIRAVAYSPDGTLVLVGFPGRAVGVWSERGEPVAFLSSTAGSKLVGRPFVRDTLVSSVAASDDRRWVFAGCVDMTAVLWELATGEVVMDAIEHAEATLAVFDGAEGTGWATTAGNVWCARDGAGPCKVVASGVHWAEARAHRDALLTRSHRGEISLWRLSGAHTPLFQPAEPPKGYWSDRAESLALRGERDLDYLYPETGQRLVIWSGEQTTIIERDAQIVTARFAPRRDAVAIQGWTDAVELWSIPEGTLLRTFESPGGVGDLAFSADGERIAIGEIGHGGGRYVRHVFVYETATGRLLEQHGEHDWQISQVAFSPDGRRLASLGDEVLLWELGADTPGQVIARIEVDRTTTAVRFLRDGRLLVVDAGRVRVYRGDELLLGLDVPVGYRTPWCLSDDERTLSVSINQGLARFDLETGEPRDVIQVPLPRPEVLPSGPLAALAEFRVGAALWRTEHGMFLHQSDGPRGWVEPLRIFGRLVAIPTTSGAAIVELTPEPSLLGLVAFEGKLRASQVVGHEVLLVNQTGRLFRSELPGSR